jgi:hypothetical protein
MKWRKQWNAGRKKNRKLGGTMGEKKRKER